MIRVAVLGAAGRMGSTVCGSVADDDELELVARIDVDDSLEELSASGAEVAVDFTTPQAVKDNVRACLEAGVHAVVGTTGLGADDLEEIAGWTSSLQANVFVAPNFAIGAVLMMRFAAEAAPYFGSAEIVERHHEKKLDAPSGTALRTADLMNVARRDSGPWASPQSPAQESLAGSRGGDRDGVRLHSLRVAGSVAHQEVVLGGAGQTLTIRHDSLDRSSFMPGVLLAIKKVSELDGLVVGLENLLDL